MPLKKDLRQQVVDYILRDIAPGKSQGQKSMDWFLERFSFVENSILKKHLAEAFYQARFNEKTREALGLRKDFNNIFIKTQILLYASIYEALIDYALEKKKSEQAVANLLKKVFYSPVNALSSSAELTFKEGQTTQILYTCKKNSRTQTLKEIQFKDRLAAAIAIGFVEAKNQQDIEALYTSRNKIHILAAAADDFKPDGQQSSKAFQNLFYFLQHANAFFISPKNP
ncbi:hypothetical protein N7331_04835 [Aeromonas caviae]|uniref:hypothetical protein n=1 Tax=Aeromonas caviae TaxID=648 RepID=UPI0024468788|nr:hypothetical protein [Aeromonas caviae]MDH0137703.1 hypothetical protein [Aeromonas caviae]